MLLHGASSQKISDVYSLLRSYSLTVTKPTVKDNNGRIYSSVTERLLTIG